MHTLQGLQHGLFYYAEAREMARELIEEMAEAAAPRRHGWAGRPI
jgi:hypothetical protein